MVRTGLLCFGLGALAALGWLASSAVELYSVNDPSLTRSLTLEMAPWMQVAVRAVLVLSVPALTVLLARSTRTWLWRHPWLTVAIVLPALLVAALPALFLWSKATDGLTLFLQVPTASLGLALGLAAGVRGPRPGAGGYLSRVLTASVGFVVVLLIACVIVYVNIVNGHCTGQCGGIKAAEVVVAGTLALSSAVTGFFAASLGYAAGVLLPRLATSTPAPSPT